MTTPQYDASLVWFRRDLRHFDHAALHQALEQSRRVYCVFIFDREILDPLPRCDRRVEFIHESVLELARAFEQLGGSLILRYGCAQEEIPGLAARLGVEAVFANRDYEPDACRRDAEVEAALNAQGRILRVCKDQVIFDGDAVLTQSGTPFSVFTPYKNAWLKRLHLDEAGELPVYSIDSLSERLRAPDDAELHCKPSLSELGFEKSNLAKLNIATGMSGAQAQFDDFKARLTAYKDARDYPAVKGPSYLSVHLRFGTISVRGLVRHALGAMRSGDRAMGAATWLSELIWRDFYFMILARHPHVVTHAFKPAYDAVQWDTGNEADELFSAWCEGRTGYPFVDAAMAQLNQTGYMHNRLRMVTASFLVKHLGIDWRRGERYFAERLNDYDLSANNGGWQWAASTGCDAQPYFRIFNPVTQSEKFDPDGRFIRRYLPQLAQLPDKFLHRPWLAPGMVLDSAGVTLGKHYPLPVVDHDGARRKTLDRYAVVKRLPGDTAVE